MASSTNMDFPPPNGRPQPPPSPSNDTTVIVIVFVSFGGLLCLAFLAVALCCLLKKKKKKSSQETDLVRVDEHLKVKEAIVPGHHGTQAVVLEIEDDVHVDKVIKKDEKDVEGLQQAKSVDVETASSLSASLHQKAASSELQFHE